MGLLKDILSINKTPESCRDYGSCGCAHTPAIPKHVFIELSGVCNLDCTFCAYSWSARRRGRMDLGLLEKILKDLRKLEPVDYVMFSALGEPTLHPEFDEACRMVHRAGYHLVVTTNGTRLRPEMVNLPIDELFISFNTPSPTAYEMKHSPVALPKLVGTIRDFIDAVPLFDTSIYLFTENRLHYPEAGALIRPDDPASARHLQKLLREWNPGIEIPSPIPDTIEIHPHVYARLKPLTLWANCNPPAHIRVEEAVSIPAATCNYYKHHINILCDGEISVCCGDYDASISLGNVTAEPLRKIFLRKYETPDLAVHSLCRRCKGKPVCDLETPLAGAPANN